MCPTRPGGYLLAVLAHLFSLQKRKEKAGKEKAAKRLCLYRAGCVAPRHYQHELALFLNLV